jgi:hypothetical protein
MLQHLDRALRVSPRSSAVLTPLLIFASSDRGFATRLADRLERRPPWARDFAYQLTHSQLTGDNVSLLVAPLASGSGERETMLPLVQRLAAAGDYVNARRVYRLLKPGAPAATATLNDGAFSETPMIAPFDWTTPQTGPVTGERRVRPEAGDNIAMFLSAEAGTGGVGASQLLLLPGGRYAFAFDAGSVADVGGGSLEWRIACAGGAERVLAEGRSVPAQPGGRRHDAEFVVPAGCPAQLLAFTVRSTGRIEATENWIDNVTVTQR